jgi:hypothetical protein
MSFFYPTSTVLEKVAPLADNIVSKWTSGFHVFVLKWAAGVMEWSPDRFTLLTITYSCGRIRDDVASFSSTASNRRASQIGA